MAKKRFIETITENRVQLVITLASVAVTLIGAFIAIKLAPIQQDLAVIRNDAYAQEERIIRVENDCESMKKEIKSELEYIRGRVDKIYDLTR